MIRVCLIGCGSIARAAHGPALRRLQAEGAAELLACCSRNPKHAEEFGRTFGFHRFYGDYAEMLRAEKPDAVFCLLPVAQNAACAADVLRRGCAVIMEKPPGVDKREADAITAAAKESGRYHAVLFNRRSMPLVRKAKELLAGETLEAVSLEMCREGRTGEDFTTTAIHGIDCLRFLTGRDYESLTFAYQEDGETQNTNYFVTGRMEGGAHVDMRFLPRAGAVTERICLYTPGSQLYLHLPVWSGTTYAPGLDTPGLLSVAQGEREILRVSGQELSRTWEGFVLNGFYEEDRIALAEAEGGLEISFSVADSLQSVAVAAAMRERRTEYQREKDSI